MPYLTVEHSQNVADAVEGLCDALRRAAIETGIFPVAGVRVRAYPARDYAMADGDPKHGFVDVTVRMREGRDEATRVRAAEAIMAAAEAHLAPAMETRSIGLSVEVREMADAAALKGGNVREHL